MGKIGLNICCLFAIAFLAGCDGSSGAIQMPENPIPMPENILESEGGATITKEMPKK